MYKPYFENSKDLKTARITYFANYSGSNNSRSTDVKLFDKLKDARNFMHSNNYYGYIEKQVESRSTNYNKDVKTDIVILEFFNGFVPSPQEIVSIKNRLKLVPNAKQTEKDILDMAIKQKGNDY